MTRFESVFVLAPFALKGDKGMGKAHGERFVVMRQFPNKWGLWRYLGKENLFSDTTNTTPVETKQDDATLDPVQMEEIREYELCAEFAYRPSTSQLLQAVQSELG